MKDKNILALGYFDGVHIGHGALLKTCRALADERDCRAGVLTFSGHPDSLVQGKAPGLINTEADRERLLRQLYGMDEVITLPFDRAMMTMPWQDFFKMLLERYRADGIVCGYDFRCGYRGEGTGQLLRQACGREGIPCAVVPAQKIDGIDVSSTCIRGLLAEGKMEKAVTFLGHPHILTGTVVHGRELGRTMGIPTANLKLPPELLPPRFGVYACRIALDGKPYAAVTNVGTRPTVSGRDVTAEPWILDYSGDLYGKEITVEFYKFLRPEKCFPSLEALRREIQRNAVQTREFFEKT